LDLAWHDGGVQQVWGLGVPIWRLPFEILAKLFGRPAFPDRLAFGAALLVLAFLLIRVFIIRPLGEGNQNSARPWNPCRVSATAVLLVFPPFVVMCYQHFDVYEEAVAYAYLYGIGLFAGLISFSQSARRSNFFAVSLFAGLAPFIRPTLGAYGLATMVLLSLSAWRGQFKRWELLAGWLMFCAGGCLLFATNQIRFGSGFEFGHNLNFNGFPIWFYTRFYNPFQDEPVGSAARELFGALFCSPDLNGFRVGMKDFIWGQSSTPRWRNFYLRTFDFSFFVILLGALGLWLWSTITRREKESTIPIEFRMAVPWSAMGLAALAVFYLRSPVLSSRYIFDFAPALAVAFAGLLFRADSFLPNLGRWQTWCSSFVAASTALWMVLEIHSGRSTSGAMPAVDREIMLRAFNRKHERPKQLPAGYEAGSDLAKYGIPFNSAGWGTNGELSTVSVFFASDPAFLQILVAPTNSTASVDYSKLRAKVGLEFLDVESISPTASNCIVRFRGPKRPVYQKGIQVVFLAYVDKNDLSNPAAPLRLMKIQWRD
jgi:hypothetical protein